MNIIIFDDDIVFSDKLESVINSRYANSCTVQKTDNIRAIQALRLFSDNPNLYFLDIMINGQQTGLTLSDEIRINEPYSIVVIITDYPNKIIYNSIYKMQTFNVLLKDSPKFEEEVIKTVQMADEFLSSKILLVYKDKSTSIAIEKSKINYIEKIKGMDKVFIYHDNGIYQVRKSLSELMKQLEPCFIRCHNSYIVNQLKIKSINYRKREITMQNGGVCYYSYLKRKLMEMRE